MSTHTIAQAEQPGFVSVIETRTGAARLVFVGEVAAARLVGNDVRPTAEEPSQKWCSQVAA